MLFHPANVPLKVFSILFKVHWACFATSLEKHTFAQSICPDKMIFVLDKIKIVSDKIFFVLNKKFCTWIKSSSLVMNCMKNDFLASDKNDFVQDNFHFVLDKNNFVQADGQGIYCYFNHHIFPSFGLWALRHTQRAEAILNKFSNNINKTHTGLISVLQGFQKCIA